MCNWHLHTNDYDIQIANDGLTLTSISTSDNATHMSDNSPASDPKPAAAETPAATAAVELSQAIETDLQTANLIEGYHVIAEWIRFADAKAAVVLTVGGAIGGLVIPTLKQYLREDIASHPFDWWTTMVCTLFAVWLFLILLSGIWAFLCILPFRKKGRHPALDHCSHFHPAAIGAAYGLDEADRFKRDCIALGETGLRDEVAASLLIDSHISSAKYARVTTSIRLMAASGLVAIAYLVVIQF